MTIILGECAMHNKRKESKDDCNFRMEFLSLGGGEGGVLVPGAGCSYTHEADPRIDH